MVKESTNINGLTLSPTSGDFCHLLITFANSLDSDQARSPTKRLAWSGSKLFHTLMIFLKEFFEKVNLKKKKKSTGDKQACKNTQHAKSCGLIGWRVIFYLLGFGSPKKSVIIKKTNVWLDMIIRTWVRPYFRTWFRTYLPLVLLNPRYALPLQTM